MFYSQTFLGRKGPLGTVWCAAHLQHRLKKSHYTSTNIPKTVDYIMYSEVPIALRMSGHLLLGVVRIYSKQVDFLFQDCNFILSGLRKAFTSFKLDLPESAMQAPVQSITLPTTFELDALDVDETYDDWDRDSHCRSREDITLLDQIPTGQDLYVAISFDEDKFESSPSVLIQVCDSNKRNEEAHFRDATGSLPVETTNENFNIPGTGTPNTAGVGGFDGLSLRESPENEVRHDVVPEIEVTHNSVPEIEVMRDADYEIEAMRDADYEIEAMRDADYEIEAMRDADYEIEVMREAVTDSVLENLSPTVDGGKDRKRYQVPSENEAMTPSVDHTSALSLGVTPPQQHSDLPTFPDVQEAAQSFSPDAAFELASPDLVIRPSPPMPQPQARKRKRKQFDECVVLKNSFIKKALDDRRDILRERKGIPSTVLGLWKLNQCSRKERIFEEPITTGLGRDIQPTFEANFTSVRAKFVPSTEVTPELVVAQTNEPTVAAFPGDGTPDYASNRDTEIEQLRLGDGQIDRNEHWESFNFPSMADNSTLRREELSPTSESEMPCERSLTESVMPPMPDPSASAELYRSWAQSPQTFLQGGVGVDNPCLPDIPEPSFTEGLDFLEADNDSPRGSSEAGEVGLLPVRTRAVAQFLKGCSPVSSTPEEAGELSLDRILEGCRRKVCARMFFETLVLKNCGLIDVYQGKPYTDIKLKLTPTLSKAQI